MVAFRMLPVGPVRCGTQLWRAHGKLFATIIVKAAFGHVGQMLDECDPIQESDDHHDGDPTKSLRDDTDLVPYLGTGEVLFEGAAYLASGGRAQARLAVLRDDKVLVDKRIIVRAPPGAPGGIARVPITYENALGGPGHPQNPVGQPHPQLVHATHASEPASLGPIAPIWRARASLLGPSHKRPRAAVGRPMDLQPGFPWEFFHAAPPDQRSPEFFQGNERIRLEHLTPGSTAAEIQLPGAQAEVRVLRAGKTALSVGFNADVLRIDGERLRVTVSWRGFFEVKTEHDTLVLAAGVRTPAQPIVWPPAAKGSTVVMRPPRTDPGTAGAPLEPELGETAALNERALDQNTLPFAGGGAQRGSSRPAPPIPGAPWAAVAAPVPSPAGAQTVSDPHAGERRGSSERPAVVAPPHQVATPAPVSPAYAPAPAFAPSLARAPAPAAPPSPSPMPAAPPAPSPMPAAAPAFVQMPEGLGTDLLITIATRRRERTQGPAR